MNEMRFYIVLCGVFLGCCWSLSANEQSAEAILLDALDRGKHISYTATSYGRNGQAMRIQQKVIEDGQVFRSMSLGNSTDPGFRYVENSNGIFHVYDADKKAIKENFSFESESPDYNDFAKNYAMSDGIYGKIECYVISRDLSPTRAAFERYAQYANFVSERRLSAANLKSLFEKSFPAKEIYYVGKADHFIYAYTTYNVAGALIAKRSYDDVRINPKISDSVFAVPADYSILIADTPVESRTNSTSVVVERWQREKMAGQAGKGTDIFAKLSNFLRRNDRGIYRFFTVLSAVIGVIAIVLIVCSKIAKH